MDHHTIAAISTAVTESGIGIVRMSGTEAVNIADKVYRGKKKKKLSEQKSHTIHYGYFVDGEETIDEVLFMIMKSPHSYTGEDTVEINCHGGIYVVKRILETLLKYGARAAEPGEFTKRAFLNGRMDLSQAEAVIDIIQSKNEYALKSSVSQLKGNVKKKINELRKEIIYHTAYIETALDDPEHIELDHYGERLRDTVKKLKSDMQDLIESYDNGKIIKEGIRTVIVGKPNAGKSSLLNVLLGEERAIVTDIAGTTRDILQETIHFQDITLNIVDTAGIRNTDNEIEKIGVERARKYAGEADLIIYVIDASAPLDENDNEIIEFIKNRKALVLLNKTDLKAVVGKEMVRSLLCKGRLDDKEENEIPILEISAKNEEGIQELKEVIRKMFYLGKISFNSEIYITNVRQKSALKNAYDSLTNVVESIDSGMPEDFYSIDLMDAYESLGNITGETIGEDLIDEIFSKFCVGK